MRLLNLLLVVVTLTACGRGVGSSTDPSRAATCADLAYVAVNQLQVYLDEAVGDQSYDEFVAAFEGDGGETFLAATKGYSEQSLALDVRRTELGCTDGELQELVCARLADLEVRGTAAERLLEPSRTACS